jgi:nucleoid-associated protein YgaU
MIPFAVRIIAIPAAALVVAATVGAVLYFKSLEKPARVATAPGPGLRIEAQPAPPTAPGQAPQATAALPQGATAPPGAGTAAPAKPPEFDIVRVEPSGETVVAGRAPAAARVELLDQGKVIAGEKVDANGQFALLPPALAGGDHLLALRITPEGQPPVSSSQSVAVAVRPGTSPVVTLAEPGKPSVVLAAPSPSAAPQQPPQAGAPAPASGQVTIRTAEVEVGGRFFATGTAPAGATVRLYLNGSHVADAAAAADGKWSLTINKGIGGGKYTLRADAVGNGGRVVSRAEVPFDAPVAVATAVPTPPAPNSATQPITPPVTAAPPSPPAPGSAPARATTPAVQPRETTATSPPATASTPQSGTSVAANPASANPVISEVATATVSRGDSLWRISRLRLGKGTRYTVIYEANASQIRNPNLIYPGQIFVMPQN